MVVFYCSKLPQLTDKVSLTLWVLVINLNCLNWIKKKEKKSFFFVLRFARISYVHSFVSFTVYFVHHAVIWHDDSRGAQVWPKITLVWRVWLKILHMQGRAICNKMLEPRTSLRIWKVRLRHLFFCSTARNYPKVTSGALDRPQNGQKFFHS